MMMKPIALLAFCGACLAAPLDEIGKSLDSGKPGERAEAISRLRSMIDDQELANEQRLGAIHLSAEKDIHECGDIMIKYIDKVWIRVKSPMSFEQAYPCVEALITLGMVTVPNLTEAIKAENDELRMRLLSYSLLRIMKREPALAHLDKLLASDITVAQRDRLTTSKIEASKWSDYKSEKK